MRFMFSRTIGLVLTMILASIKGFTTEDPRDQEIIRHYSAYRQTAVPGETNYYQDYVSAYDKGYVKDQLEHVKRLTAISYPLISEQENLTYRKAAILAFVSGRYGFRPEPATSNEMNVLKDALVTASFIHRGGWLNHRPDEEINLVTIRRDAGLQVENDIVRRHLIEAQKIIFSACMLVESIKPLNEFDQPSLNLYIQKLFRDVYLEACKLLDPGSLSLKDEKSLEAYEKDFANSFTVDSEERVERVIINGLGHFYGDTPSREIFFHEPEFFQGSSPTGTEFKDEKIRQSAEKEVHGRIVNILKSPGHGLTVKPRYGLTFQIPPSGGRPFSLEALQAKYKAEAKELEEASKDPKKAKELFMKFSEKRCTTVGGGRIIGRV